MNVQLTKRLFAAMENSDIPESFIDGKTIETEADIDSLVNDYQALKLSVRDQDDIQAMADIEAWNNKKVEANVDLSGWEPK